MLVTQPLIPTVGRQGQGQEQVGSVSSRPDCSTKQILAQSGLHRETLSWKKNETKNKKECHKEEKIFWIVNKVLYGFLLDDHIFLSDTGYSPVNFNVPPLIFICI